MAVLELVFKPGTDDIRETRAFPVIKPVVVDGRRIIERREGLVNEGLTW